ncbi:MAG: hypothetical protein IPJ71_11675 [Bdellovibrionales bacterium]|nr:hypothetical protein [Bdellovibrionales bacterium]
MSDFLLSLNSMIFQSIESAVMGRLIKKLAWSFSHVQVRFRLPRIYLSQFESQATPPRNPQKLQFPEEKLEERGTLDSSKDGGKDEPSFSGLYPAEFQVSSDLGGESGSQSVKAMGWVKFEREPEEEVRLYSLSLRVRGLICGIGDPWRVKSEN